MHDRSGIVSDLIIVHGDFSALENPKRSFTWLDPHMSEWVHQQPPNLCQLHLLVSLARIGANHGYLSAIIDPCIHEVAGPFSPDLLLPTPTPGRQIGSVFFSLFHAEWFGHHWLIGSSTFLAALRGLMRAPRDVLKMVVAYLVPPGVQCHNIMTFSEH